MNPFKPFIEHPASVGETYLEHLGMASGFGWRMVIAGSACFIHGLLPFLFTTTGSRVVTELHQRMVSQRRSGVVDAAPTP